jgi:hypothetical protein
MRKITRAAVACAALAAVVVGVAAAEPPKTDAVKQASASTSGTLSTTSVDPPKAGVDALTAVLSDARTALGKAGNYTCTFTRQVLVKGKLSGEDVAEMKVRNSPAGVYVRFAKPDLLAGKEVAYTAARKGGKMRVREAGAAGARGFHTVDLDDEKFLAENRVPVTDWTMAAVVDRAATAIAREKTLNNLVEVFTSDYTFAGCEVTRYEVLTRRPHAFRYAYRMLIYVDKEKKLPVRFEAYDQPKSGGAAGELFEAYSFSDLKLNAGLGENSFDY